MWMQDYAKVHQQELAQQAQRHALAQAAQAPKHPLLFQRLTAWLRPASHHRDRRHAARFGRKKTIVGHGGTLYADEVR
jgi:hypothetical protein